MNKDIRFYPSFDQNKHVDKVSKPASGIIHLSFRSEVDNETCLVAFTVDEKKINVFYTNIDNKIPSLLLDFKSKYVDKKPANTYQINYYLRPFHIIDYQRRIDPIALSKEGLESLENDMMKIYKDDKNIFKGEK